MLDMSKQSFLLSDDVNLNYIMCLQKSPYGRKECTMSLSAYASESLENLKINDIDTQIAALRLSYEEKYDGRDDEKMKEHHGPFFKQLDLLFDSAEGMCLRLYRSSGRRHQRSTY